MFISIKTVYIFHIIWYLKVVRKLDNVQLYCIDSVRNVNVEIGR